MTEEEKMLKGIMHNAEDESLTKKLMNAKKLCQIYNNIDITLFDERNKILKKLFSKTSKKFTIMPTFYCDYGFNIEVGENFYSKFGFKDKKEVAAEGMYMWFKKD